MKKKMKKGFTLVELLVVIAILAVLATVSVVGYTSFITKANNSNALTELKQAQEVILSQLIDATGSADGEMKAGGVVFTYDSAAGKITFTGTESSEGALDAAFATPNTQSKEAAGDSGDYNVASDLAGLKGYFEYTAGSEGSAAKIVYTTVNGKGAATWTSGDVVVAGGTPHVVSE